MLCHTMAWFFEFVNSKFPRWLACADLVAVWPKVRVWRFAFTHLVAVWPKVRVWRSHRATIIILVAVWPKEHDGSTHCIVFPSCRLAKGDAVATHFFCWLLATVSSAAFAQM